MKLVRFHPEAEQELVEHEAWYRQRSEVAAQRFLLELDHAIAAVAETPERWPTGARGERRYVFPRFPFTLLYRIRGDHIFITAVATTEPTPTNGSARRREHGTIVRAGWAMNQEQHRD